MRDDNTRTYATSEKIFPVGSQHKVAILHSGATEFMGHPYEILISIWKQSLTKPLVSLNDYVDSFLHWLVNRQNLFSEEDQQECVFEIQHDYFLELHGQITELLEKEDIRLDQWKEVETLEKVNALLDRDIAWITERSDLEGLTKKWAESRYSSLREKINEAIELVFDDVPRNADSDKKYLIIAKLILFKSVSTEQAARLVFLGFGESEIYPVHTTVNFQGFLADKIRYTRQTDKIGIDDDGAMLHSHGQAEAIHTFLRGYDNSLLDVSRINLSQTFNKFREYLDLGDDGTEQGIFDDLQAMQTDAEEDLNKAFEDKSNEKFVDPFTSTLSGLPMTSLGNMAESLVQLQVLRQSSTAIQGTVGGPIDLAVITIENGFQWFRHKTLEDSWRTI